MGFLCGTYARVVVALFVVLASQSSCAFSVLPPSCKTPASSTSITTTTQLSLFNAFNEGKKALVRKLAGDYDQGAVRARLDSLIADNPVLFLSFETCPFCVKAKALLDAKGAKYVEVDLTKDPDGKGIRAEMADVIGRTSVPAIWIDGTYIGGCNDGGLGGLIPLDNEGKIDKMLAAAGAI